MNKLISFRALFVFGVLSALLSFCTKENYTALELEKASNSVNPYKISEQDAIASLKSFLNSSSTDNLVSTKSSQVSNKLSSKRIGKIRALRTTQSLRALLSKRMESSIRTKIHEIDPGGPRPDTLIIPDTLIYIVNFDDDGFALLSADNRISSQIIAVVESGSISPEDFNLAESLHQMYSDTLVNYDYNSWGLDEDGDEIGWEDTLTVSLYEEMPPQDTSLTHHSPDSLIIELVSDYVVSEIINTNPHSPGNGIDPGEEWQNPESGQSGQEGGGSSGGSSGSSGNGSNPITYTWTTTSEVPEMLSTRWFQKEPLNRYCPVKAFSSGKTAIGCGAVAMGQILAYHEYPNTFYLDNYYCDWSLLKSVYSISNPDPNDSAYYLEIDLLSRYLYSIARICHTHFWDGGSWSLASKCKRALHAAQYSNIHKYCSYREDKIITMLDNDSPVFIQALQRLRLFPVNKIIDGHSWVIDGYRIQDLLDDNGVVYNTRTLMHCNWGWHGQWDGYYASKIFKIGEGVEGVDPNCNSNNSNYGNYYKWHYRIITYDNPNQ